MWKRIENDQPMCNDSVWMADRLSGYFNSSRRAAHMKMEPALERCIYLPSLIQWALSLREELAAGRSCLSTAITEPYWTPYRC